MNKSVEKSNHAVTSLPCHMRKLVLSFAESCLEGVGMAWRADDYCGTPLPRSLAPPPLIFRVLDSPYQVLASIRVARGDHYSLTDRPSVAITHLHTAL